MKVPGWSTLGRERTVLRAYRTRKDFLLSLLRRDDAARASGHLSAAFLPVPVHHGRLRDLVTGWPACRELILAPLFVALSLCACITRRAPATSTPAASAAVGPEPASIRPSEPPKELPRGGRTIFPDYRLVGYCGTPGAPALGELQGNLPAKAKALEARAAQYAGRRKTLPVFELIAVVVQSSPGPDGKYRHRVDDSVVDDYLRAAREAKALLLLNIQPGRSDFLTEVKSFESYLREPDVGIALDPEWAMNGKGRPGATWGQTTGDVIDDIGAFLSSLVEAGNLPEKVLVFHEVVKAVVKGESSVRPFPGVVVIKSVDGLGPVQAKVATYANLMANTAAGVHPGLKLFFDEDTRNGGRLMTPQQVLRLSPEPEYVMHE